MKIKLVEIQNFRKLKSVRVDFSDKTTVFVGANNSGKTSAITALRHFLIDPKRFTTKDFTLSHWKKIDKIGENWVGGNNLESGLSLDASTWSEVCPAIDVWLDVDIQEVHHVRHLSPTLQWEGGLIGVRLKFVPKDLHVLRNDFVATFGNAKKLLEDAKKGDNSEVDKLKLWPTTLADYIERRLKHFERQAYLLDPAKLVNPTEGVAAPQLLSDQNEKLEMSPFEGLIKIDEVDAQRGFSDKAVSYATKETDAGDQSDSKRLSDQLRAYYKRHIDPTDAPEAEDLEALYAIQSAQEQFDAKLQVGFSSALEELSDLGYPGITDPKVTVASQIRPMDSLNHASAVQYDVSRVDEEGTGYPIRLPEQSIGLGYQNLISIVFRLMGFRDAWMQVGKAGKTPVDGSLNDYFPPLIHLVIVEEPEAHLHAQVQQVFIRQAYEVLRNHPDLGTTSPLSTQLIVSTHSSHIAHEIDFSSLRYFRRLPACTETEIPISSVSNLSEVFGPEDETSKFVARYLKATHCDLFFADAAILVEGPVERMLLPLFIRKGGYAGLRSRYITLLEIGGSHAHRLKPLFDMLHLPALVITDLDPASDKKGFPLAFPEKGKKLITRNPTLRKWVPGVECLDELLALSPAAKTLTHDNLYSVRAAYQMPVKVTVTDASEGEAIPTTFEDALIFDNLELFREMEGTGLIKKFREVIRSADNIIDLGKELRNALTGNMKAGFALDLLFLDEEETLNPPRYIGEGLNWLQTHLALTEAGMPTTKLSSAEDLEAGDAGV
ncbi:MAG: AAA family ATPase [Parvibaculaceae bacterium]|nr:AAA family ATPase [Parvibaculaceae bacterium]